MDFINKQHIPFAQVSQQGCKVAGFFNGRAAGYPEVYAHLVGYNARKCGFAQARRAVKQHMVKGLAPLPGCLYVNGKVLFNLFLAHIIRKDFGP